MNDLISRNELWHKTFICDEVAEVRKFIEQAPAVNPLPCKIGDTAWVICNHKGHKKPKKGVVSEMYYTDDMKLCIVVKFIKRGTWGKDVFGTQEEAWEAIRP